MLGTTAFAGAMHHLVERAGRAPSWLEPDHCQPARRRGIIALASRDGGPVSATQVVPAGGALSPPAGAAW
jgi:hypothetical protein